MNLSPWVGPIGWIMLGLNSQYAHMVIDRAYVYIHPHKAHHAHIIMEATNYVHLIFPKWWNSNMHTYL